MGYKITCLPGDGIGPEIMAAGMKVLGAVSEKYNFDLQMDTRSFGGAAIDESGKPLPDETLQACQNADAILLAAIGGPKWDNSLERPEVGLLQLRKQLGLYANIRPLRVPDAAVHLSPLKEEIVRGSDFVVVRELTGGLYFGEPKYYDADQATDTLSYQTYEIERIIRKGFQLAQTRKHKLASVDKANVLASSKLWRETAIRIAREFPDVKLEHFYVDAAAMQIITKPTQFDVIVTENLFGDILSDEASVLTGSLGVLPSASYSETGPALYEPIHGSAPDIAGKDEANPLSMIYSISLMLRDFDETEAAEAIDQAANKVMQHGFVTKDLGGSTSLSAFTEKVLSEL
ncbi:3-isopropylmalate dehydrogenase [Listeria floridensis FSL S10-1187]|uniref:3-isopropylmalate dehydrogenase n=1 Tax=Listeria floridensis FSL S10-1187 TaxID=1265817 RepID=A0ABN0RBU4_9LIST|nr:3-isopropylmalate dehydrogenase [Listeria floridensis]EUJ25709.1 3-isopropylmalate dehydrogenase [Listeria floridensis FSL S10-1187]